MIHPIYQTLAASLAFTLALAPSGGFAAPELAYYQPADAAGPVAYDYDVVVYGGTPAGVTAAIQAGRMEPVFMILGQSAGTAAALAIEVGVAVQDVPYEKLEARLETDGQRLEIRN